MIEDSAQQSDQAMGEETQVFLNDLFKRGIYKRLRASAYQQAGARAHKVDPSLAALEAVVQGALRRAQFRGTTEQAFWAWLRTILVNQVIEGLRRSGAHALSLSERAVDSLHPSREVDPAIEAEKSDQASALNRAVEQLEEQEREVFCLYHRSDVPKPVVAALLGVAEATLRQRARQVRRKLKALMQGS